MKTLTFLSCVMTLILVSCTSNDSKTVNSKGIDVATALTQLTTLKTSDFGKTVRYIPLETTDDCLINNDPVANVLNDKIIITTQNQCFIFDKSTGKFITSAGHIGEDPEGYSGTMNWVDRANGMLYFGRQPNQLVKYTLDGQYSGNVELPFSGIPFYLAFNQSDIIGYYSTLLTATSPKIAFFDRNGVYMDSIVSTLPPIKESGDEINYLSVFKGDNGYGNWVQSGLFLFQFNNGNQYFISQNAPVLWYNKNEVRFKESYGDTIYTIKERSLEPYMIFHTGEFYWPKDELTIKENNNKRVVIPYVSENDKSIFFQCIKGLHENKVLYNGIYNKEDGSIKMSKYDDKITDDLTSFMPFKPLGISSAGEYVGLVEAADVLEWLEENPEAEANEKLNFLNQLAEDSNPVLILVEP